MTIDMVDSMHGMAQATWDLRRSRRVVATEPGGSHRGTDRLLARGPRRRPGRFPGRGPGMCHRRGPRGQPAGFFRRHSLPPVTALADAHGVLGPAADDAHRVVSPLAMDCKVPFDRRYIFAGLADRMSTFGQARGCGCSWGRPALAAYPGGHVGFFWSSAVRRLVEDALSEAFPHRDPGKDKRPGIAGAAGERAASVAKALAVAPWDGVGQIPHPRHEIGASDEAEADPILLRQHRHIEPRPIGNGT